MNQLLIKKLLHEMVYNAIRSYLKEAKMEFDNLYSFREGSDITKYVLDYLSWSEMGKMNPNFSALACKLHKALMYTLSLYHEEENDRITFSRILRYLRILNKHTNIKSICVHRRCKWKVSIEQTNGNDISSIVIDAYDFDASLWNKAIVFEANDGVEILEKERHDGTQFFSTGLYITNAKMTEEMKRKIYAMGLVPALRVIGSYHENFIFSVGVLPEMVSALKKIEDDDNEMGLYFSCEFKE